MNIYNRDVAIGVLGSACNNLNLLRDRNYEINQNDFDDMLHKLIFSVLQNLALEKDISEVDGFIVANYLANHPVQYERFKAGNGVELIGRFKEFANSCSFDYCYKMMKKYSLLRRYDSVGMDVREIYNPESFDVAVLESQIKKLEKASIEQIKQYFKEKLIEIDLEFQTRTDSYSFEAGDGVEELLAKCKEGVSWGATFQSELLNAVFGGMGSSKLLIRSSNSGGGKSRQALGDLCNISCKERYIPKLKKWISREDTEESTFISTELTKDEVHLAILSTIAGVKEERIKRGETDAEEDERLARAVKIMKESNIHIEYSSNFSIAEIENIIERSIIRYNCKYIFFDYIQVTANLSQELNRLFGYVLREDQMLNQLSTALKNIANKYDVFISTSTQLNRNYKHDQYLDATHLRGGQATLDKADYGVITVRATKADLEKLKGILEKRFGGFTPTHAHHIIKNRGGKWTGVILWVEMDLDTINVYDGCGTGFATTQDYEFIKDLNPIKLI